MLWVHVSLCWKGRWFFTLEVCQEGNISSEVVTEVSLNMLVTCWELAKMHTGECFTKVIETQKL